MSSTPGTTTAQRPGLTPGHGTTVRAAVYVRISQDRTGAGLGVTRQEQDCRALCARKGWQVADVYPDDDVSATSGKPRPQWLRLLADINAGLIDAIVCWHVDRLTRSPRELEDVINLHDRRGVQLATVTGEIDLSTPTGRLIARTLGAAARHEAEHKAERQRRQERQAAEAGKPHSTGATRPYGWMAPGQPALVDAEADIIREAARRVLAGESLNSVARVLNNRQVRTSTGRQWTANSLKTLLVQARLSGRREYRPTDDYRPAGKRRPFLGEITATEVWPQIITVAQSDRLRAMLTSPDRRSMGEARTYLLTGAMFCALCGTSVKGRNHNRIPRYGCIKAPGLPGCGKVSVDAARADSEVRDLVLTALSGAEFFTALMRAATGSDHDATHAAAQLRRIDAQRDELAAMWASGEISRKEWLAARAHLDTTAGQLTRVLARTQHARTLAEFAALDGDAWDRWQHPHMTDSARRALIAACCSRIELHPAAVRGRRTFDPDRIKITWRTT